MPFEPLHYADRLRIVNPDGDVGLITLWSPYRTVARKLDPLPDRVAVVANLYGDGMYAMLCNLLWNPQVRHLVAVGEGLGLPTTRELTAFLEDGLEDAELLGRPVKRIRGTERVFPADPAFDAEALRRRLTFRAFGTLKEVDPAELTTAVAGLPHHATHDERVRVELPSAQPGQGFRPSHPGAHQVVRARPLEAWQELVARVVRFGRPVELDDGPRRELLNAKVVITDPAEDPADALAAHGFDRERFRAYGRQMLDPALPDGIAYSYGNRLRAHFGTDALAEAGAALRADPRTRRAYVSLWDTRRDVTAGTAPPCLATLVFRTSDDGRLTLTATYRAHNLLTAWLMNVYGLMAVQQHVAADAGLEPGTLTVVSHALSADPRNPRFALAEQLAADRVSDDDVDAATGKRSLREDPHGYFTVSADHERGLIVAEHRYGGALVQRYEAERAVTIEQRVAADMAISLVSHAMWLGRELTRREQELRARR